MASCKADGYIDDRLYAALYVEGARKAVGDARLRADLVKRGIDREAAASVIATAEVDEAARLALAFDKIMRVNAGLSYPTIARKLERLGFPAHAIYRHLRAAAADDHGALLDGLEA